VRWRRARAGAERRARKRSRSISSGRDERRRACHWNPLGCGCGLLCADRRGGNPCLPRPGRRGPGGSGRARAKPRARRACDPPLRAGPSLARGAVPGDHDPTGGRSMNTTALNADLQRAQRAPSARARLVRAELLKLRKRRGLLAPTAALTILPMIVAYMVLAIAHIADP